MFKRQIARRTGRGVSHVHILDTQARTLEDACDIIAAEQHRAKLKKAGAERSARPLTFREEMRGAKLRALNLKRHGKVSLAGGGTSKRDKSLGAAPRLPHPLKDLPLGGKRAKAREMFTSGAWGTRAVGTRRLARAFAVTAAQMAEWLEGVWAPL